MKFALPSLLDMLIIYESAVEQKTKLYFPSSMKGIQGQLISDKRHIISFVSLSCLFYLFVTIKINIIFIPFSFCSSSVEDGFLAASYSIHENKYSLFSYHSCIPCIDPLSETLV